MKERETTGKGLSRKRVTGLLGLVAVLIVLYYSLLPSVGLRVTRMSNNPVPLEGSELNRSRRESERSTTAEKPVNLIVFVADGLGFAHLAAARAALHGIGGITVWDRFTTTGWHRPHSATGFLVDSAAAATALATGVPTDIGAVGVDSEGAPLTNLFERASELAYRTGIVTDSYIWDATPAAFVTHVASREEAAAILRQLAESPLEILVGELEDAGEGEVPEWEPTVKILETRFRVFGPGPQSGKDFIREGRHGAPVAAIFEEDQLTDLQSTPALPELLQVALDRLSSDERPFLLLVESEEPDSASHEADFDRLLRGMEAIEATLEILLDFSDESRETLLVFTSDHETGGLALSTGDSANSSLRALWSTSDHSGAVVPILALGPGSEHFGGIHATWQIGRLFEEMLRPAAPPLGQPPFSELGQDVPPQPMAQ